MLHVGLGLGLALRLGLGLRLGFEPSSPTVRELVLSLTWLSFPLVRFRHNHYSKHNAFSMEDKMVPGAFERARNYG